MPVENQYLTLRSRTKLYYIMGTIKQGVRHLFSSRGLIACLLLVSAGLSLFNYYKTFPAFLQSLLIPFIISVLLFVLFAGLFFVAYPHGAWPMLDNFIRVGFANAAGEAPYLVKRAVSEDSILTLTFFSKGLPLKAWDDAKKTLETALNLYVAKITEGPDRRTMVLTCVPPDVAFQFAEWQDSFTHRNDAAIIVLGKGLLGEVTTNIDVIPHILIGGSTGSGKTVLLKTILWQMIVQADVVYIADFKGGIDYPRRWHTFAHLVTDEQAFLKLLERLTTEIESRKAEFNRLDVQNIKEYRHKTHDYMQRIVVSCDEVAELLDKTGVTKERKETIDKIAAALSLIARQGRAFGVHLVLATQRPDANVIPSQVKSNIGTRICGRADATLSTIILGDGKADEEIPKDAQGRFIMEDGTVFQGYYLDDTTD